ncbi:MAG: hypothetical protein LUC97_05780 [Clostridiales bacterium]|nr:hypothetical protein [Clostridiales bacterium]
MNNYNENTGRRVTLRGSSARTSSLRRTSAKKEKSGFLIRLNICLTVIAAVFLLSRINTEATNKIAQKTESLISEQTSFSDIKDKAAEVFMSVTSGKTSEDVFSDTDSNIEQSIIDTAEQDKALEEQLKNR